MAGSVAGSVTGAVLGVVATGSVFAGRVVLGVVLSVVLVLCGVVFANSCSSAEPTKSGGSVAYAVSADSQPTLLADLTSMAEMGVLSAISQELSALERAGTEQV